MRAVVVWVSVALLAISMGGCIEDSSKESDEGGSKPRDGKGTPGGSAMNGTGKLSLRNETKSFQGSMLLGTQDPFTASTACGEISREDVDQKTFDWVLADKEADGKASYVGHITLKLTGTSQTALDIDVFLFDPSGKQLGAGTSPAPEETVDVKNLQLAAGTYKLRVVACNLVKMDFTLAASAEYFAK